MDRVNGSYVAPDLYGAGKDGFKDGNKALGIPATIVNAEFLNAIQEEIANVIEGQGIVLDGGVYTQLRQAILDMIADNLVTVPDATTAVKGKVELSTDAETQTGIDPDKAVTPASLSSRTATLTRTGLLAIASDAEAVSGIDGLKAIVPSALLAAFGTALLGGNGYFKIPVKDVSDGTRKTIIVQYGSQAAVPNDGNVIVTLPTTFPTAAWIAVVSFQSGNITGAEGSDSYNNLTTNQITLQNGTNSARTMTYITIGY